jgi:hypothetical protein
MQSNKADAGSSFGSWGDEGASEGFGKWGRGELGPGHGVAGFNLVSQRQQALYAGFSGASLTTPFPSSSDVVVFPSRFV